jgi:hypothetical protein
MGSILSVWNADWVCAVLWPPQLIGHSLCRNWDYRLSHRARSAPAEAGLGKGIAGLISCGIAAIFGFIPLVVGFGIV